MKVIRINKVRSTYYIKYCVEPSKEFDIIFSDIKSVSDFIINNFI